MLAKIALNNLLIDSILDNLLANSLMTFLLFRVKLQQLINSHLPSIDFGRDLSLFGRMVPCSKDIFIFLVLKLIHTVYLHCL